MNKITECKFCKQKTADAKGCGSNPVVGHNQRWNRIPCGKEVEAIEGECSGCNVVKGGFHHVYCPLEECPRCNGKMNVCQCFYTIKE